ncbi:MAG: sigma 54-interacting transcriptional regulator [Planctomycetia bacterium]
MPSHQFHLVVRDPIAGQTIVPLTPGQRLTIGRAPTNQIVLQDDRASRAHAEIRDTPTGWMIRDLDSRNGTLVGGERLSGDHGLVTGDTLTIGRAEILFCAGDPPTDPVGEPATGGLATSSMSAEYESWEQSIVHRRSRGRLLEDIRASSAEMPRVGRAAGELCRLAFALGRAASPAEVAALALETAAPGIGALRGAVLLTASITDLPEAGTITADSLRPVATIPASGGVPVPPAAVATVLATDEAVLACSTAADAQARGRVSSITTPVRAGGRPVGVLHVEADGRQREATADDLEFVMAVSDAVGVALENLAARESLSSKLASTADENERLRQRLRAESKIIGGSDVLQGILAQVVRVATTKATVLIRGESGVGKELVASAIHESSDRSRAPFVCLNCAALTETLLESELFGHEKGAFTGATERKAGKFEAAQKGTLFLDEIGEMSAAIQAKFLRVLEGHAFERVGGSQRVQVDVRVVAATNRDLEEAVKAGQFRRDLYFRLKVVEILVPPLRKRPEDVELLARHFLDRFVAETGRRVDGFTTEAIEAMQGHHWPGNIRELRNCIERAVVLAQGPRIDAADLALTHLASPGDTGRVPVSRVPAFTPQSLDEMERKHVLATLEAVGGNKTKASAILGIERSTLDRKLARWAKV